MNSLVIFVDDEPNLLSGLKRSLRRERKSWDSEFALGGQEALRIARDRKPQAIVSDMRMPIMDGTELLQTVSEEFPETIRIVLSGEAELDGIYTVAGVCHRFFLKPIENTILVQQLDTLLTPVAANPDLIGLARYASLPTPTETIARVREATKIDSFPIDQVRDLIRDNIALSAKILQIANSQYFGRPQPISSVNRAIDYIGPDALSALLVRPDVANHPNDEAINAQLLALDSRAAETSIPDGDDSEVNRSATFLQFLPELCNLADASKNKTAQHDAESARFLMTIWGLPEDLIARTMNLLAGKGPADLQSAASTPTGSAATKILEAVK